LRRAANVRTKADRAGSAPLFAALGDETRLRLVARLCDGGPMSIARLTEGFPITRQAITKHLRMMEDAGLVNSAQSGRESVWQLEPRRLDDARRYLNEISTEWDHALVRLRRFVER
jgi:DNA-binding transcriptional ArsR family regulator